MARQQRVGQTERGERENTGETRIDHQRTQNPWGSQHERIRTWDRAMEDATKQWLNRVSCVEKDQKAVRKWNGPKPLRGAETRLGGTRQSGRKERRLGDKLEQEG